MESSTFEQAVAVVESLPTSDRERFSEWFQQQEKHDAAANAPSAATTMRFQLALQWLKANQAQYLGQWVALDGDRLLAAGADGKQVYAAALATGVSVPLLHQINATDELPFGGW